MQVSTTACYFMHIKVLQSLITYCNNHIVKQLICFEKQHYNKQPVHLNLVATCLKAFSIIHTVCHFMKIYTKAICNLHKARM